ncbi:putative transcriptional regulatory protein Sin3 [Helianthus annuus]|nr:putative transcriptional regulatory protein Sin3 [Helianthus annuus]
MTKFCDHNTLPQLLAIAMDEVDNKLLHLYTYERMRNPGSFVDELYYANARVIANDNNIYRFESSPISKTVSQSQTWLIIRLMDPGCDMSEAPSLSIDPNFEAYPTNQLVPVVPGKTKARLFLKRYLILEKKLGYYKFCTLFFAWFRKMCTFLVMLD